MMRYFSLASWAFFVAAGIDTSILAQTAPRPVGQRQGQPARRQQAPARPAQRQARQVQPQQTIQRQPMIKRVSRQAGGALAPSWIPLPDEHEERLKKILRFWEFSTAKIERYRCKFRRYEYGVKAKKSYSAGVIKFAAPDKGLFRVDKIQHPRAAKAGEEPEWVTQSEGFHEHWVCDGKSIYEFDHNRKQLVQRSLPPEIQGQRITEGPLPFMFGAKEAQIRQRFWIRPFWREGSKGEYWLELFPKTREDSANYRKLQIVIAETDFLPKGMILFFRDGTQTSFVFDSRENNWSVVAQQLNFFHREFFEPRTPAGWQKVVEPIQATTATAPQNGTRQAEQRPQSVRRR